MLQFNKLDWMILNVFFIVSVYLYIRLCFSSEFGGKL